MGRNIDDIPKFIEDEKGVKTKGFKLNFNNDEDDSLGGDDLNHNPIGNMVRIIGYCTVVAGLILGYKLGDPIGFFKYFEWALALPIWIGSFVSGVFIIALSEIINLLSSINGKIRYSRLHRCLLIIIENRFRFYLFSII